MDYGIQSKKRKLILTKPLQLEAQYPYINNTNEEIEYKKI